MIQLKSCWNLLIERWDILLLFQINVYLKFLSIVTRICMVFIDCFMYVMENERDLFSEINLLWNGIIPFKTNELSTFYI